MSLKRAPLVAATVVLAVACSDAESPFGPSQPESALTAAFTVVDASGPTGLEGFHFMPPIGTQAPPMEDLDASLLELLSVEICAWTGSECVEPMLRRITAESQSPERLHISEDAIYTTVWSTRRDDLDSERIYRIRVLAGGTELGHVDVDVIEPEEDRDEGDSEHVHLIPGSTLSIGFVVEQGTLQRTGPAGGTVHLADGQITLEVPEGALSEEVLLTATPTTDVPMGGPPVVPGTAWDFRPDGIQFAHPIVMTIAYDPANIPPGVEESELRIHKVVDGEFEQQNAGLVDLVNHTVSAEVDGFSVFVVIPRDPENPEDILPPDVRSMQVFDPVSGTFGDAVTLDTSAGDANLTFKMSITDNITGVQRIQVNWLSPTGRQLRFPCLTSAPPDVGSDTNGEWNCQSAFPQYAEAGLWQPQFVFVRDKINNSISYSTRPEGLCDFTGTQCITDVPQITVESDPQDITPPMLQSLQVSLDTEPRMFGSSVSVDASMGFRRIVFELQATDDLSGVGGAFVNDGFRLTLTGPSNQSLFSLFACGLTEGTTLSGSWECLFNIPEQAEAGTWNVTFLRVPDRAGNGGGSGFSDFRPDGTGQLCNPGGNCVTAPTVEVLGMGDGEPPALVGLGIALDGADVVTSPVLTDDISGVSFVRVTYRSAETNQFQNCFASLMTGTINAGVWSCTISFSPFAARGQWTVDIFVGDRAGNTRFYSRRASDGHLCYFDPDTSMSVCDDFGDTDIILE